MTTDLSNSRDCEHGHQRGKCELCELAESQKQLAELLATVKAVEKRLSSVEDGWTELEYIEFCLECAAELNVAITKD